MAAFRSALVVLAACLALPPVAAAGTVSIADGVLTFTAGAAEINAVSVGRPGDTEFVIVDTGPAPQTSDAACNPAGDSVTCAAAGVTAVRVVLDDLDDSGATAAVGVPVTLDGGDGNDTLGGGAAGDTLLGGRGEDTLSGGDGEDLLDAGRGDDDLLGGAGADVLDGGTGDDVLDGGAAADQHDAGAGSDVVLARDDEPDGVVCGSEFDEVTVDFPDTVSADCEQVDRSPDPSPPAAASPTPTPISSSPPTSATPPPRDRTAPVILVSKRSIRVDSRGRFRVVLVSANEASVGAIVADTDTSPRVRLGRTVFVLRAGARIPVRIALSVAGRRVLRRARGRSVPIRVRVAARDGWGNSVLVTAHLRLRMR